MDTFRTTQNIYKNLDRDDIIRLLEDNDSNGCYSDNDCIREFGFIASNSDLISNAADQGLINAPTDMTVVNNYRIPTQDIKQAKDGALIHDRFIVEHYNNGTTIEDIQNETIDFIRGLK